MSGYEQYVTSKALVSYIEEKKQETHVVKQIMNEEKPLTDRFIQLGHGPMQNDEYFNSILKRYHYANKGMAVVRQMMIISGVMGAVLLML